MYKEIMNNLKKVDILNYYPYGNKNIFTYWLCGDVNLKTVHRKPQYKNKSIKEIKLEIYEELARAMSYLIINCKDNVHYKEQTLEAFTLWHLMKYGDVEWTKKPLKGLSQEEKIKVFKQTELNTCKLLKQSSKYIKDDKYVESYIKNNGVYKIEVVPLENDGKILYTKQELCAIHWIIVYCLFENLC